jgi:hypothetical protein
MIGAMTAPVSLAGCLGGYTLRSDTRAAARALPASLAVAQAAHDLLLPDLQPVLHALDIPAARNFKLALSAFIAVTDVNFSALLAEQRSSSAAQDLSPLFLHVTACHFCAMHRTLLSSLWDRRCPRVDTLLASLSDLVGTDLPIASPMPAPGFPWPSAFEPDFALARTAVLVRRVQLALPTQHELLCQLSTVSRVRFSTDGCTLAFNEQHPDGPPCTSAWLVAARHEFEHELLIILHGGLALAIRSSASLAPLRLQSSRQSRFLPAALHWSEQSRALDSHEQREGTPPAWFAGRLLSSPPRHRTSTVLRPLPSFHVTTVISKRAAWIRRFRRHLGQAARVILDGKLCIPCDIHEGSPLDAPNLKSCFETPEQEAFVDSIISEYLVTGVCSWYPPTSKPLAICPLGVVPKRTKPWFRLVIDARGPNKRMSKWASNMKSLASSAHIFQPGSVCWTLDISSAYVCSNLMGCRHAFTPRVRADGFKYEHVGCEPETCSLGCSKCLLGFRWRQQHFVFNAPMFGGRVSGNILDTLLAPVDRWIRSKAPMLRWVDDFVCCVPPRPEYRHDTSHCGGVGSCFMCDDTFSRARLLQTELHSLLDQLGFILNDKMTPLTQRGEFIGLGWDTLKCTFWMPAEKASKIAALASDVASAGSASRRHLAKIRGRLVWFSPCLPAVRLLTRSINEFIGNPETDAAWDAVAAVPAPVLRELLHWSSVLPSLACHERPLWTLRPGQILELHRVGYHVTSVYMETDASRHGWGCIIRYQLDGIWGERRTAVPWPPGQSTIQVHCEAEALHQALLTFLPIVQGNSVLHVTDCAPTLDLPDRGSASSLQLQQTALAIWTLCSARGILLHSAWVPGDDLIKSGCDALSRDLIADPHCASLRPVGWSFVLSLSEKHSLPLDVDWFADDINRQLPAFWSRNPSPGSAGHDALSAPSWAHSFCDTCQVTSSLRGYFFPPVPLLDRAVAKAKLDGACGIFVVPRLAGSVWWPVLLSAALSPPVRFPAHSVDVERQHCSPSYARYVWNAVVFDFAPQPRSRTSLAFSHRCRCHRRSENSAPSSQALALRDLHVKLASALLHS